MYHAKSIGDAVLMSSAYRELYQQSIESPDEFWAHAAEDISWIKRWDRVSDQSRPPFVRWFPGGVLNTCYNAVDRHVARGRGKQGALPHHRPGAGTVRQATSNDL